MRKFDTYGGRSQKLAACEDYLKKLWKPKFSRQKMTRYWNEELLKSDQIEDIGELHIFLKNLQLGQISKAIRARPDVGHDRVKTILRAMELTIQIKFEHAPEEVEALYKHLLDDRAYLESLYPNQEQLADDIPNTLSYSNSFPKEAYDDLQDAEEEIWIIDTFLDDRYFRSAVEKALANNPELKIHLLLAHLHASIAKLRTETLESMGILPQLEGDLWFIAELARKHPGQIQLRCYNQLPGLHYMGTEKTCYSGWFWMKKSSLSGPWIHYSPDSEMGKTVARHVQELWKISLPIDLARIRHRTEALSYLRTPSVISFHKLSATPDLEQQQSYFRCMYNREDGPHFYGLTYLPRDHRIIISCTRSGEIYRGTYERIGKTALIIAQSSETNRTVYIAAETGSMRLQELGTKEITLGLTAYINPEGEAHTGRIILQKIQELPDSYESIKLTNEQMSAGMHGYLQNSGATITHGSLHTQAQLDELFGSPSAPSNNEQAYARWAGIYDYYVVHPKNRVLLKNAFILRSNGELSFEWDGETTYRGHITQVVGRNYFFKLSTADDSEGFCGVLHRHRGNIFKGIYSGLADQRITGGRIYASPSSADSLAEIKNQRIPWGGPEHLAAVKKHPQFDDFFHGRTQSHYQLDDPAEFRHDPHLLKFPPSGSISSCVGTYEYYYASAHNIPSIRKLVMEIRADHSVEIKGLDDYRMQGHALIYDNYLVIRLFSSGKKRKFRGIHCLYSLPGLTHSMAGISTITANRNPMGRMIICFRTDQAFETLQAEQIPIHWDNEAYHQLNQQYPGLATLLTGTAGNYIQTPTKDNMVQFSPKKGPFSRHNFAEACFLAACYQAEKGKSPKVVERHFKQAIQQGFADQALFEENLAPGGSLHAHHTLCLQCLQETPGSLLHPPDPA